MHKTLSALLAAAVTTSILGVSPAAQALAGSNGRRLNGTVFQGERANGVHFNGKTPQGLFFNGIVVQGIRPSELNGGKPDGEQLNRSAQDDADVSGERRAAASSGSGFPRVESIRIRNDILRLR